MKNSNTPPATEHALELDAEQMTAMVSAVMPRLTQFIETLEGQSPDRSNEMSLEQLRDLQEPLPRQGESFDGLLDQLFDELAPISLNAAAPGFMGYVPGGGIFHAAVADLISDTLNRYVGVAGVAPALTQLEANVVRWFCEIVGFPAGARGFLTSGGSLANWSALVTAREAMLGEDFSRGVIYSSNQAHHCVAKAARLAGFPAANLRILPCDSSYRVDLHALHHAIASDRAAGLTPAIVVASAGTTNTGAIDPLTELADIARRENLWLHVDGAYGGLFNLTERGAVALRGIERADSLALDPHKTLFLPYGTGALLVRNGHTLRAVHSSQADYLPPMQADDAMVDFCELSPELTRPFRGLRVWLAIKMHGAEVFRRYMDEKLDLARWIESRLRAMPQLVLLAPPALSILAFALTDTDGAGSAARNQASRALLARINARGRVLLTGTMLGEIFAIRIAIGSFRTHQRHMQWLLEDIASALQEQ